MGAFNADVTPTDLRGQKSYKWGAITLAGVSLAIVNRINISRND